MLLDDSLTKSFTLAVIAGGIFQPILADPYLTRHALNYPKSRLKLRETPWWVCMLWTMALTQLCYFWYYLELRSVLELDFLPLRKYLLFIVVGSLYFYIFELIVCNFTFWWSRRNCKQPLGVAAYATEAEIVTVMTLPIFCALAIKTQIMALIALSAVEGIAIAGFFCYACKNHKIK